MYKKNKKNAKIMSSLARVICFCLLATSIGLNTTAINFKSMASDTNVKSSSETDVNTVDDQPETPVSDTKQSEEPDKDKNNVDKKEKDENTNVVKDDGSSNKKSSKKIETMDNDDYSVELKWADNSTSTKAAPNNSYRQEETPSSRKLNVVVKGYNNEPATNSYTLTIKYSHIDQNNLNDSKTGFVLNDYTGKTGTPSGTIGDYFQSVTHNASSKTLTYKFSKQQFQELGLELEFVASYTCYEGEVLDIDAEFKKDNTTVVQYNDTDNVSIAAEYIKGDTMTSQFVSTEASNNFYEGVGEYEFRHSLTRGQFETLWTKKIDFSGVLIHANGQTKTYKEWINEGGTPPVIFKPNSSNVAEESLNGYMTVLKCTGESTPRVFNYASSGKSKFVMQTTATFVKGAGSDMPFVDFKSGNNNFGAKIDIDCKLGGRGLTVQSTQNENIEDTHNEILALANDKIKMYNYFTAKEKNTDIKVELKRITSVNVPYIHSSSKSLSGENKHRQIQYLFSSALDSARNANDAKDRTDKVSYQIPGGFEITHIKLPLTNNSSKYTSVKYADNLYQPGDTIKLANPTGGTLELEFNELQFIRNTSVSSYIVEARDRVLFLGTTDGLSEDTSYTFSAKNESGSSTPSLSLKTLKGNKYNPDATLLELTDLYTVDNNKLSAINSFVERDKLYYMQSRVSPSSSPVSNALFFDPVNNTTPVFENPVLYYSLPSGIEFADVQTGSNSVLQSRNGFNKNYESVPLETHIKEIENAGMWANEGGRLIEVKVTGPNNSDVYIEENTNFFLGFKISNAYSGTKLNLPVKRNYLNTWNGDAVNLYNSSNSTATNVLPSSAMGKTSNSILSANSISKEISEPPIMAVNGYTWVGDRYQSYITGDESTMPARPAGSTSEKFKMQMIYGLNNPSSNSTAYFVMPQQSTWKPIINSQPVISTNIATSYDIYYTTNTDAYTASMNSANGELLPSSSWTKMTGQIPNGILKDITAFKYQYTTLKKGDYLDMEIPFSMPAEGSNQISYGEPAVGNSFFWRGSSQGEYGRGGVPAVKFLLSDSPQVLDYEKNNSKFIPTEAAIVQYGAESSEIPQWWKNMITVDDLTADIKLDSLSINYIPQGKTSADAITLVNGFNTFEHKPYNAGTDPAGKTHAAGNLNSIKEDTGKATIEKIDTKKPGIYTITYKTTSDIDTQTGTAQRVINVVKTNENSIDTTPGSLSLFYDNTVADVDSSSNTWDQVLRGGVSLEDGGETVNAKTSTDVTFSKIDKVKSSTTAAITSIDEMMKIPGEYKVVYNYADGYGNNQDLTINVIVKYRTEMKAKVAYNNGMSTPVSGAGINPGSGKIATESTGLTTFNIAANEKDPINIPYSTTLTDVPNGLKMPTSTSEITKNGSVNINSSEVMKTVVYTVEPVEITATFKNNDSQKWVKTVTLYKDGTNDPIAGPIDVSGKNTYTFDPLGIHVNSWFDGDYYMEINVNKGFRPTSASDFARGSLGWDGGVSKTGKLSVLGSDIVKNAAYDIAPNVNHPTYKVTFNGNGATKEANPKSMTVKYPSYKVSKLPAPPQKTGHTFEGWNSSANGKGTIFTTNTVVKKNITVYAQWKTKYYQLSFNLNGGQGKTPATQSIEYGKTAKSVSKPDRTGYKFISWNTQKDGSGTKWNFNTSKMPAKNVMLYAQWDRDDNNGGGGTTTNRPSTNNGGNGGQTVRNAYYPTQPSSTTYNTEVVEEQPNNGLQPQQNIAGSDVPLDVGAEGHWALLNLIMAVAGLMLCIIVSILAFTKRRKDDDIYYDADKDGYYSDRNVTVKWIVASIVAGIVGIILFFLTEDITKAMIMVDRYTIFNLIVLAAEVVTVFLAFKKKEEEEDDPQGPRPINV